MHREQIVEIDEQIAVTLEALEEQWMITELFKQLRAGA
jgi:hypothetical protein